MLDVHSCRAILPGKEGGYLEVFFLQLVLLAPGALGFWDCRVRHCSQEHLGRHWQALLPGMAQKLIRQPRTKTVGHYLHSKGVRVRQLCVEWAMQRSE